MCQVCNSGDGEDSMLLCGDGAGHGCDKGYHIYCLQPALPALPEGDWYCVECVWAGVPAIAAAAAKKATKSKATKASSKANVAKAKAAGKAKGGPKAGRSTFRSSMSSLVRKLAELDEYGLFSRPVDREEVPDYYELIKRPMDLGKAPLHSNTCTLSHTFSLVYQRQWRSSSRIPRARAAAPLQASAAGLSALLWKVVTTQLPMPRSPRPFARLLTLSLPTRLLTTSRVRSCTRKQGS
jgi:hypothetical protein